MQHPLTTGGHGTGPAASDDPGGTLRADLLGPPRQPVWRRPWVLVPSALLAAAVLALALTPLGPAPVPYTSAPVEQRTLVATVTAIGNLQATDEVEVGAEISGRVVAVLVEVNDPVRAGQPLALIDPDRLEEELRRAEAARQAAEAGVDAARAVADLAAIDLTRLEETARLSGGRIPAAAELDRARAHLRQTRAQMRVAAAQAEEAAAVAAAARTALDRATIRAPIDGIVLRRRIDPGQTLAASFQTPVLFTIAADPRRLRLDVRVDEADIGRVGAGQTATFTVDAFPGDRFPAVVERVDLGAQDSGAGTGSTGADGGEGTVVSYRARLRVDNPDGRLRPGMTATATIVTETLADPLVVPLAALRFLPPAPDSGALTIRRPEGEQGTRQETRIGRGSTRQVHVIQTAGPGAPAGPGDLRPLAVTVLAVVGREAAVVAASAATGLAAGAELRPGMRVATGLAAGNGTGAGGGMP
ncbi:MAG: hypothetical protein RLY86_834 [Pseudomonadota bacterium]|jgi:HlyD family secretion protein